MFPSAVKELISRHSPGSGEEKQTVRRVAVIVRFEQVIGAIDFARNSVLVSADL